MSLKDKVKNPSRCDVLKRIQKSLAALAVGGLLLVCEQGVLAKSPLKRIADPRDIRQGSAIYEQGYCDQPYMVITKEGDWLCVFTTGSQKEGLPGQHVVATRSKDHGQSWSAPVDIEPADGPEASWGVPLVTPNGRVYVFYDYNGDRVDSLPNGKKARADMLGWYSYKYSDDSGLTWLQRYRLPVRVTACDRSNDWRGQVQILWGVCEPVVSRGSVYFAFTKLGRYMLEDGEGCFFRSDNILAEPDVAKIEWQMLPDGDRGLRDPQFGSVQEEHNIVAMANGDLFCIYRTTTGRPACSYSRDGAHTWTAPVPATYTPGGRPIKHPRACPRLWKCGNGKYLLWFHNHGGKGYDDRNPAWVAGGVEKDGFIHWSQPEILLYDEDDRTRISYPDLIEQDGRYWVSETQKTVARVHAVDSALIEGTWRQFEAGQAVAREGIILELDGQKLTGSPIEMPGLPDLAEGRGFSIDFRVCFDEFTPGRVILDSRDSSGIGIAVSMVDNQVIHFTLSDGRYGGFWDSDLGLLSPGKTHHVVITVDGGPRIITYVIDGVLCDGGDTRQFGWGRFPRELSLPKTPSQFHLTPALSMLRLYNRPLRTSEAVANFRSLP
jgi:hypothetical protein